MMFCRNIKTKSRRRVHIKEYFLLLKELLKYSIKPLLLLLSYETTICKNKKNKI